jgi:hypothetical protein
MNKVFGVGLSRTGTRSLATALGILGFKTAHFPSDERTQLEVLACCRTGNVAKLSILKSHDALTDTPVCCIYKSLDSVYPNSKFILTVRRKESWLISCERYWRETLGKRLDNAPNQSYADFINFINLHLYGTQVFSLEKFSSVYDDYLQEVTEYFEGRQGHFLVLDICSGEGWAELCAFLNVERCSSPFPRENLSGQDAFGVSQIKNQS